MVYSSQGQWKRENNKEEAKKKIQEKKEEKTEDEKRERREKRMSGAMPYRTEDFGIEDNYDRRQYG